MIPMLWWWPCSRFCSSLHINDAHVLESLWIGSSCPCSSHGSLPPSNPGRLPAGKLQAKPLENSLLIWLYGPIKPGRGWRVLKACCTTLNSHHVIYVAPYWSSRLHSDRLISSNSIREECVNYFYFRCKLPTHIKGTPIEPGWAAYEGYHSLCSLLF